MKAYNITAEHIAAFGRYLQAEEKAAGTRENYLRHVRRLAAFLDDMPVTKERVAAWKERLLQGGLAPGTVNAVLVAVNHFLKWAGLTACRVKALKVQRRLFREDSKELKRAEYDRLVAAATAQGKERLALLLEAICATGVRVSEVKYITVEAAKNRRAVISLKGKVRTILIPGRLAKKLLQYARKHKIASGEIFLTRGGRGLNRKQIWAEMKRLCDAAGVEKSKVFPHNLRHVFAREFYRASRDIVKLADMLGHSSIETTRLYLVSTGAEHERTLDRLGLVG